MRRLAWTQLLALLFALLYATLAILSVAIVGEDLPRSEPENLFIGMGTSWMLTVGYFLIAALGVGASVRTRNSELYGAFLFVAFTGLTAYGLLSVLTGWEAEVVNIGWANVILYAITAIAGVLMAYRIPTQGFRRKRGSSTPRHSQRP